MAFLFGRNKQKVIVDLTKSAKDLLVKIQTVDLLPTQQEESLAQKLSQMKLILQGTQGMYSH
jgi:chaperonin cofactor prefoldin